jgi:AcrR family transcriptional regulator
MSRERGNATPAMRNIQPISEIYACVSLAAGDIGHSSATLASMGRPRSEEAREAALTATVEVLLEAGVEGVTFEEVAQRSGVAKTTLYRHFGSKPAMVAAAAGSCFVSIATPDTGDLGDDLRIIFDRVKEVEEDRRLPDVMPALLTASGSDPELHELVLSMLEERRRPIRTALQLAQLRGEISRELDLDTALALLIGPFVQRRMVDRQEITPEFRDTVLDNVVAGLRATADAPVA